MDVPLVERAPAQGTAQRIDWEVFVRGHLPLTFMRFDGGRDLWHAFLKKRFGTLERLNQELNRPYRNWGNVELPYADEQVVFQDGDALKHVNYPPTKLENNLLLEFAQTQMPAEHIRAVTGENLYRKWETFWFTFTRAYGTAINHIFRWRRSLWNTAVFCSAVVLLALLVNPLCAYALSRFNLPGSYKILLFLMATMAFPAEVTMIPNFLILKSFPLLRIITAVVSVFIGAGICTVYVRREKIFYPILGAVIGGVLGATVLADAVSGVTGLTKEVPLLNTFWALILPGVASGFSIFILKGFFDSLPRELYDSAVVDGASELRIFAQITMPMSKPVLAVIALWSFTAAYGSFTWALIICQDPKMWTLMVHLYQYQMYVDPSEIMAGLALACLPTLFVFIIVQKVILKGIVVPTFK